MVKLSPGRSCLNPPFLLFLLMTLLPPSVTSTLTLPSHTKVSPAPATPSTTLQQYIPHIVLALQPTKPRIQPSQPCPPTQPSPSKPSPSSSPPSSAAASSWECPTTRSWPPFPAGTAAPRVSITDFGKSRPGRGSWLGRRGMRVRVRVGRRRLVRRRQRRRRNRLELRVGGRGVSCAPLPACCVSRVSRR